MNLSKLPDAFVRAPLRLFRAPICDANLETLFSDLFEFRIPQRKSNEVIPIVRTTSSLEKIADPLRDILA
jgi:hypothetical protein